MDEKFQQKVFYKDFGKDLKICYQDNPQTSVTTK